jgi:hypothetical protein
MNGIYGSVFDANPPTRTTIQPLVPGGSPLFRVSVVAEPQAPSPSQAAENSK